MGRVNELVPASAMNQSDEQDPSAGQEDSESRPASFVQRLHRRFGKEIDPEINLQDPGEGESGSSVRTGGRAAELAQKLSEQMGLGPRYKVGNEIARGGMGTILRVWDEDLRRNLAMKVMHTRESVAEGSSSFDEERLSRFLEEAQITGQLDHPGVVPVHDLGIDHRGRCYFTMRLVRGRELKEILDLTREGKEGWTRTKALGLVLKVCEAMAFAHSKGVVHRDLKPSNVMVGRFGEVYVMDWGLARVLGRRDSHDLRLRPAPEASSMSLVRTVRKDETESNPDSPLVTMDGDVVGTPSFMAPEQAQGKLAELGPRSDVYSLGSILYYMFTGQAPYVLPGERVSPHTVLNRVLSGPPVDVRKLARDEPAEIIAICEKAMSRDPAHRYASMLAVADDIQAFLENRVVRAYEGGSLAEFKKWVLRNRGMAAGIAGMVTLAIASALGFAWQQKTRAEDLAVEQKATEEASAKAVEMASAAQESAAEAEKNLELANKRAAEARENEARAAENERDARRREYMANLLAAHFSLKLNDMREARARLSDCNSLARKWEWEHLRCAAQPHLLSFGKAELGSIDDLAWFPDGSRVVLLRHGGKLEVRDAVRGDAVPGFEPKNNGILSPTVLASTARLRMDLSSDAQIIAVIGDAGVELLAPETGESLGKRGEAGKRVNAVAFARDGKTLATAGSDGSLILWDPVGAILYRLSGHTADVTDLAWSPDGKWLASASLDGTARVWNTDLGQQAHVLRGHRGAVRAVAWDDTSEQVFSAGDDQVINQWSVDNGRLTSNFTGHEGAIHSLQYDPATGSLVSASADRTVRVWNVRNGGFTIVRGPERTVLDAAMSPDGATVLVGAEDGTAQICDVRGDPSHADLLFHTARVQAALFSPDGDTIASGDDAGEVVLWDALSGEPVRRLRSKDPDDGEERPHLRAHGGAISALAFDPEGRFVFSASADGSVRRWAVDTGQEKSLYAHPAAVTAALLASSGIRLVTGCADNVLRVFDVETGEILEQREGVRAQRLTLHEDGRHFAAIGRDLVLLDLEDPEEARVLSATSNLLCCAFSPDEERFATGALKGEVALFDARSGKRIASDEEHKGAVRAVAFHPDHPRFATGSADGTVRIRDATTNLTMLTLEWPGARVTTLAFSADGARLLVGSQEGPLRIFETGEIKERHRRAAESRALLARLRPRVEQLFDEHLFLEEVLRRLQGAQDLSESERSAALRLAQFQGDDPARWVDRGLADALFAGNDPALYARALDLAERARSLTGEENGSRSGDPIGPRLWLALGVARYRLDRPAEALEALSKIGSDGFPTNTPEHALHLFFLSMARYRTGDFDGALAELNDAKTDVERAAALVADPVVRAVHGEATDLVESEGSIE